MLLRTILASDVHELLAFECENSAWFEQHIGPRPNEFYSLAGVSDHVAHLLDALSAGKAYPGVIEDQGKIVGRVNLTKVEGTRTARLGYRVGLENVGKGIASFGVTRILERVNVLEELESVTAFVSTVNASSHRVLEKHGFIPIGLHHEHAAVGGRVLDCIEYALQLA